MKKGVSLPLPCACFMHMLSLAPLFIRLRSIESMTGDRRLSGGFELHFVGLDLFVDGNFRSHHRLRENVLVPFLGQLTQFDLWLKVTLSLGRSTTPGAVHVFIVDLLFLDLGYMIPLLFAKVHGKLHLRDGRLRGVVTMWGDRATELNIFLIEVFHKGHEALLDLFDALFLVWFLKVDLFHFRCASWWLSTTEEVFPTLLFSYSELWSGRLLLELRPYALETGWNFLINFWKLTQSFGKVLEGLLAYRFLAALVKSLRL